MRRAPWRAVFLASACVDEPAKGLVVARETGRLAATRRHPRLRRRRLPGAAAVARAGRAPFARSPAPRRRDRPVPLLRLGLEGPGADPRLRPPRGAADAHRWCTTVSASARSSTAATSPSAARRSQRIGGFDRTIEFHGEDTNLGRRLTPLGLDRSWRGECWVWTSARRYRAMGKRKVFGLYVRNFWSEILRHRPADREHLDVRA